jgi:leucyl/phenylalanyl-tRNA--protein transferase
MNEYNGLLENNKLLNPEYMIRMYAQGAFPMADANGKIEWYLPRTRAVILPENFNIPRSLKKFMQTAPFEYRYDYNILEVITGCADRAETWISEELIKAYKRLIDLNYVHSVEVYENNNLVGGLYGITIMGAFFGESMFSKVPQASKCAMVKLYEHLSEKGYTIVDVQYITEHLKMFGAKEISYNDFLELLKIAYTKKISFSG